MSLYSLARPFLFKLDAEQAHGMTIRALKMGLVPSCPTLKADYSELKTELWGRNFPNPVGMAAGFDKNAEVIGPLFNLGFGFVEVGTVTPKPQEGNPRPRIFRDPKNGAVINRMGFPNKGLKVFKDNISEFLSQKPRPQGVIGINIGMNKDQDDPVKDYTVLIHHLGPLADYLVINISSPNTPGLRDLQQKENLAPFLDKLVEVRKKACRIDPPPLLLKLAPDLTKEQQEEIAEVVLNSGIDGLILTNTTLDRPDYLSSGFKDEKGGLSGTPVKEKSTEIVKNFAALTKGKLPIIGVGGISSAQDAQEKLDAGASLVQLYSGLVYEGPYLPKIICEGLTRAA